MTPRDTSPLIDLAAVSLASGTEGAEGVGPLYRRLRDHLRDLIRREHLRAGTRLPASRVFARDLGVSRTTVELAYDELVAEGFVERRRGSGTYVVDLLPARPKRAVAPRSVADDAATDAPLRPLSSLGERLAYTPRFRDAPGSPLGFAPCLPSEEVFPFAAWNRLLTDVLHERSRDLHHAPPLMGDEALRTALADHLARTRRVQCDASRLLIVASTQQALALLARLLVDEGDAVWLEEPGYLGARAAFAAAGARLVPVPVDADGIDVAAGEAAAPEARVAFVTPSHQYPTGVTLSAERRVALLAWARERRSWIVEDDYDSEFRHVGEPLAPLQSFDRDGCVIYIGTLNKVLFPGLQLGYVVLPQALVEPATRAMEAFGGQPSALVQATCAAFVEHGHLAAHLRRARLVYRERRAAFLDAAAESLGELVVLGPSDTGVHVCARLPPERSDAAVAARAARGGLHVPPLSPCYLGAPQPGLILGYAGVDVRALRAGVRHLAEWLDAS